MVVPIGDNVEYGSEITMTNVYLEPIPVKSFLGVRLIQLFTQAGLPDLEAQILLSLILHGGKMKSVSLAKNLNITISRLISGLTLLENLGLTFISHHRPKTVILAISVEELNQRICSRTLDIQNQDFHKLGSDLLLRFHKKYSGNLSSDRHPLYLMSYFENLKSFNSKLHSIFYIMYFSFSSLYLSSNQSFILASLIADGGQVNKRNFYKEKIKNFQLDKENLTGSNLEHDLKLLEYSDTQSKKISGQICQFFQEHWKKVTISGEREFNILIQNLNTFCQTIFRGTSGKRESKDQPKSTVSLVLFKSLEEIGESLLDKYRNSVNKEELKHLQYAMRYVRFIDPEIFQSTLNSYDAYIKKFEREIKHVKKIQISIFYPRYLELTLERLFDNRNREFDLEIIINEELLELFKSTFKKIIHSKSLMNNILPEDKIAFIPVFEMIDGNLIIMTYEAERSSLTYFGEISPSRPATFTTLNEDVSSDVQQFQKILKIHQNRVEPLVKNIMD